MTHHFIQLTLGNKTYKDIVSTTGCSYVADFIAAIRASPQLPTQGILTLFQPNGTTEIDPETLVTDLKEIPWKPMVVTVEEIPVQPVAGSSRKQVTYKGLGVEASCRKYFDALARKLALFYRFKWGPEDENDYPTFCDVCTPTRTMPGILLLAKTLMLKELISQDLLKLLHKFLFFQFVCLTYLTQMSGPN